MHKTVALGRVVPPKRHLKLENVLLQAIALEGRALRLIRRAFCNDACYEMHSQFGKVEKGRLNESLLYECTNFPGSLFTVMTSHVGVVTSTNEAMPKLSPLKI